MKYRTVPPYPPVDREIDVAIQTIVSQQMSAKEAMQPGAAEFAVAGLAAGRRETVGPVRSPNGHRDTLTRQRSRYGVATGRVSGARLGARAAAGVALGLAPALVVLALMTLVPAIWLVVTSLTPLTPTEPGSLDFSQPWQNYRRPSASIRSSYVRSGCRSNCRW